jgi:hypothetical protein
MEVFTTTISPKSTKRDSVFEHPVFSPSNLGQHDLRSQLNYVDPANRALSQPGNLVQVQPQQITARFNNVVFSSKFDSGNMSRCLQHSLKTYHIYISGDSLPYQAEGHYRCWFYFNVTGVKRGESLTFSIRNMGNQSKLYKNGLKPVMRVKSKNNDKFQIMEEPIEWELLETGFTLTWTTKFDWDSSEKAYFAWTFPYSFEDSLIKSDHLLIKYGDEGCKNEDIYYKREILNYSVEGRP